MTDFKIGEILKVKFTSAFGGPVEIYGRVRELKGSIICCNEIHSDAPFFCYADEVVKVDLPETVLKSLMEVS